MDSFILTKLSRPSEFFKGEKQFKLFITKLVDTQFSILVGICINIVIWEPLTAL